MAIFTKGLIGAGLAGTIALGTLVTWNGAETIDLAKTKITEAGQQIGVFKSNETKLVGKVNLLKGEKATLTQEVADLKVELQAEKDKNVIDKARIVELEAEIATKNAKIAELTAEIATLNTDLENSAGDTAEITQRINDLEKELNAANTQAEALQYTLDETVLAEPDQVAVDDALSGSEPVIVDPEPTPDPDPTPDPSPDPTPYTTLEMVEGTPITVVDGLVVNKLPVNNTLGEFQYYELIIENETGNKTYAVSIDGTQVTTVAPGAYATIGQVTNLNGKHLNIVNVDNAVQTYDFTLVNK